MGLLLILAAVIFLGVIGFLSVAIWFGIRNASVDERRSWFFIPAAGETLIWSTRSSVSR